jgi:hypothetical protein
VSKLTTLALTRDSFVYNLALTSFELFIDNGVQWVPRVKLGRQTLPTVYTTGDRTIAGNMQFYLKTGALNSTTLLNNVLADNNTAVGDDKFANITVNMANNIAIAMPNVLLEATDVGTDEATTLDVPFTCNQSSSNAGDEISIGTFKTQAVGNYYWSMNEPEFISYSEAAPAHNYTFDTALTFNIGDTIAFDFYNVDDTTVLDDTFIESADQLLSVKQGTTNNYILLGCTITIDGIAVATTDPIVSNNYVNQRMVITSTINTTINLLLNDSTSLNARDMGVTNVDYEGTDGTLHWDCQDVDVSAQPESTAGLNNIIINSHTTNRWSNSRALIDSVSSVVLNRNLDTANLMEKTYSQPSLRADSQGFSIRYNRDNGFNNTGGDEFSSFIPYQDGFTIEFIIKPDAIVNRGVTDGRVSHGISSTAQAADSLMAIRFDNWTDPTVTDVFPCFTLMARDASYDRATEDSANRVADVRSPTAAIMGNTYHFLATIRPSDDTIEFWVNGVSLGTDTIPSDWYDSNGQPLKDVLDASQRTFLLVGATNFDGSVSYEGDSTLQDIRIHLLEADQAFATQQASFANFT